MMPIFEFQCSECGQPFEELVRSANAIDEVVCPACQSANVKKKVSLFASKSSGSLSLSSYSSSASCNTGST
jgi:putative FmdB family regulatory protein